MTDYSSQEYLDKLDAYWRAANYVSVGQLYLKDNPLLRRPLKALRLNQLVTGELSLVKTSFMPI